MTFYNEHDPKAVAWLEWLIQLNPALSRWLIGFPDVWDFCGAMAMQSFRKSRKSSSKR